MQTLIRLPSRLSALSAPPNYLRSALQRQGVLSAASSSAALAAEEVPVQAYSRSTSYLHWFMAAGILTCFSTVQGAMYTKDKELKGKLMMIHKSTGVAIAALALPRIAMALFMRRPGPMPGGTGPLATLEESAGHASHMALYGLMAVMAVSGVAMGYFGGSGLPFYGLWTIPGAVEKNGTVAKNAFGLHKRAGLAFEYLVPLHMGAATMHALRGHSIFSRINPFGSAAVAAAIK